MLWIALFIVGLLGLLAGLVPLLLNGMSRKNFAAIAIGTVLLVAGAAGVIMKPGIPVTMPHIALLEPAAPESKPEPPIEHPAESAPPAAAEPTEPAPQVRVIEPVEAPAPSNKDESQLEPTALPDPVPVTTTAIPSGEPGTPTGPTPADDTPPTPAATPAEEAAAVLGVLAPQQPKDQAAFTQAVRAERESYDKAAEDERDAIQPERAAAICKALPKPEVKNWVGKIDSLDADSGKRLTVTVTLPDGTLVKTWNNAMSDMDDKTLVAAGSPVAQTLGKLKVGDTVRFDGTFFADEPDCYRSTRLSLMQSMMEPSFLFRFTAVEKL